MTRRRVLLIGLFALIGSSCGATEPGEVVIRMNGSVSSLVTTIPEATTTTAAASRTTTSLPGVDPGPCPPPGEVAIVTLSDDVLTSATCPVGTEGKIRFSNLTDEVVTLDWAGRQLRVDPQRTLVPPELVGEVLTPGLHAFDTSLDSTPTIRVAAPDSGFGAAQVGLRTFGGIRPGQRVSEAEAAAGVSIAIADRGADCSLGWVAADPHSPLLALAAADENPIILRAEATTSSQLTLSDVGLGSTVADLRAAYGDQLTETAPGRYAFEPNEAIDANYRLVFETTGADGAATVTAMRIGRLGEVERSTTCP